MIIIPRKKLSQIPTGNPYVGQDGYVDIGPTNNTMDVAEFFPGHQVDVPWRPAADNIESHVAGHQIRVFYTADNLVKAIEILAPDPRIPSFKITELQLEHIELFGKTLAEIESALVSEGYQPTMTDTGFDIESLSISFYSHEFENDLDAKVDTVYIWFE